jgi:hypothetical protein
MFCRMGCGGTQSFAVVHSMPEDFVTAAIDAARTFTASLDCLARNWAIGRRRKFCFQCATLGLGLRRFMRNLTGRTALLAVVQ